MVPYFKIFFIFIFIILSLITSFFFFLILIISIEGSLKHRRSEGTSSVAFEVLVINCQIDFTDLFIYNCLTSNINLFIFNCLTSNFCFPKNISFASRREQLFMDAIFRILNSPEKMMACYLRDTN